MTQYLQYLPVYLFTAVWISLVMLAVHFEGSWKRTRLLYGWRSLGIGFGGALPSLWLLWLLAK